MRKLKKRCAALIAIAMMLSYLPAYADVQERLPANGLDAVIVTHTLNNVTDTISPSASVSFALVDNKNSHDQTVTGDLHDTQYYDIILKDTFNNTIDGRITHSEAASKGDRPNIFIEQYLNDKTKFKNGTLYQLTIQPGHKHVITTGNNTTTVDAPLNSATKNPVKYFITDLDPTAEEIEDEIVVKWEYIPGATYELTYVAKDATTKDEVDAGDEAQGIGVNRVTLKADDLDIITENGAKKVKYTLENTLAGQKYSVYVLVKDVKSSFLKDNFSNVGLNTKTPKIISATKSIGLEINSVGNQRIALTWNVRSWMTGNIQTTKIYRRLEGEAKHTLIGTIHNNDLSASDAGRFEHDEPSKIAYYYVEFVIAGQNESIKTKEVEYVPSELRDQPLKPQIPEPFSDNLSEEEINQNKGDYLVTDDDVAIKNMKDNTFHVSSKNPVEVQLVWDAPTKKDDDGNDKVDYDVIYDIWVAEDKEMLENTSFLTPIAQDVEFTSSTEDNLIKRRNDGKVVGFKYVLDEYITSDGEVKSLIKNKSYYIKIVAKKQYSTITEVSEPTVVAITIDKEGDIYTPPSLAKPPLQLQKDSVTKDSVGIEWLESWYEIKAENPSNYTGEENFFAKLWNSVVYTGGTPSIKFTNLQDGLTKHTLLTKGDLDSVKAAVSDYKGNYVDRYVTLGEDVKYEVKALLYDDIITQIKGVSNQATTEDAIKIEKWIMENEKDSTEGWQAITETDNPHDGFNWKGHTISGLEANTRYIVLIRAYRQLENGDILMQTYPSYVIATTLSDYEEPEATPTVPVLNKNGVTDNSVSVWWTYHKDFDYEVVYSRLEDPNSATAWPVEISNTPGDLNYVADGEKAIVTINGLLPETTYNVWIRAKQKEGSLVSNWSNPVNQKTNSLDTPNPPKGLGTAYYTSILEAGQDFPPVSSDYITVEWEKDVNDVEGNEDRTYSYVIEFANNPEFADAIVVDTKAPEGEGFEIISDTLIKFTGLEANKPYYVRGKTVLTFTKEDKVIVKESAFTSALIRIWTKTSNDEYDGGANDNIVIYDEPIKESYVDGIWTYELQDVAKITSEMLNKGSYYYTITMENYNNKYDANIRRVKMPKVILDTIIKNGKALKIVTNRAIYDMPATSLKNYAAQYSADDTVQIDLTRMDYTDIINYSRTYDETYYTGEKLEVRIKNTAINRFDAAIKVSLKLDVVSSYNYSDFKAYQYSYAAGSWSNYAYQVDRVNNSYLTFSTMHTGLNALYERNVLSGSTNASYSMNQVVSKYNVKGLGTTYFKNDYVNASQYVKLLLGIRTSAEEIDVTVAATTADYTKAKAAGIYTSSSRGRLTKEQALAGIIKLYELSNGMQIKPSSINFAGVSSTYKTAVQKAYAIGLITDIRPQEAITYEELCDWLIQVS